MDEFPKITKGLIIMAVIRWTIIMLLFIGSVALLSGCGQRITSGAIISKQFIPEHEEEVDDPDITIGDITIPGGYHMETVPDEWVIVIEKECEDGKTRTRTIRVTKGLYADLKEGQWYNLPEK